MYESMGGPRKVDSCKVLILYIRYSVRFIYSRERRRTLNNSLGTLTGREDSVSIVSEAISPDNKEYR